jgi:hypothetical protein
MRTSDLVVVGGAVLVPGLLEFLPSTSEDDA